MIKKFENYNNSRSFGFDSKKIENRDRVIIDYKDSKFYRHKGEVVSTVLSGSEQGDCTVLLDNGDMATFYYTFLFKITDIFEIETGEVISVLTEDLIELSMSGLVFYDKKLKAYYFKNKDRWQIETMAL